ncbi:MAG: hypothetical protein RL336_310 [Pseudomonadota bacterium]|jgi:drug/metabolite transporter (DMT)-like permease
MPTAYRYGLLTIAMWSTSATAFKLALATLSVSSVLAIAATSSALLLLAVLAFQKRLSALWAFIGDHWRIVLGLAIINPVLYYLVLFKAYDALLAQQAQAINYSWAICLSLLSVFMLGQKLSSRDIAASVLAYVGVVVVASGGDVQTLLGSNLPGVLWALLSTLLWSFYWVYSSRAKLDPVLSLCSMFLLSLPMLWIMADWTQWQTSSLQSVAAATYVGFFEMGASFVTWLLALQHAAHVSRIANLIFLSPFLSLLWINGILGEAVLPSTLLGLAMILLATLWQQTQKS